MNKFGALTAAALAGSLLTAACTPPADTTWDFTPISGSAYGSAYDPAAPWILPAGYTQTLVRDETGLDIYPGSADWNDMNTVNETGPQAGRFLYTTHEVRGATNASNGSVSVLDLETGVAKVLVQRTDWDALDGILWTPWGTLLFAEETDGGKLFEVFFDPSDPTTATAVVERTALGAIAHEGIEVGPDGELYVIDEFRGGAIYKFVPDVPDNLAAGVLYALKTDGPDGTGNATWLPLPRAAVQADARAAAIAAGASTYQRPEDIQRIGDVVYIAVTEGPRVGGVEAYDGRVLALDTTTGKVTDFVKPGVNVAIEVDASSTTGFDNADNLAESPDGRLVIVEDNVPSDIWFAEPDGDGDGASDGVTLFASLTDTAAEGTGIYFAPGDPSTLYVNIQHSTGPNDSAWAIRKG